MPTDERVEIGPAPDRSPRPDDCPHCSGETGGMAAPDLPVSWIDRFFGKCEELML